MLPPQLLGFWKGADLCTEAMSDAKGLSQLGSSVGDMLESLRSS